MLSKSKYGSVMGGEVCRYSSVKVSMVKYGNFMLPSVLCYENKVVRKATNYLGIICVRIFNNNFLLITQN